jgi:hypothetical protein
MPKVSKIKLRLPFGNQGDIICELTDAKHRFSFDSQVVVVAEGQVIRSFDELIEITDREDLKEKGFVEVKLFPLFSGG